jgi:alpha-tubulin suppressor-like RCC1 family protein
MSVGVMGILRFFVCLFLLLLSSASFAVKDRISLGYDHTCAIDNTGVVCWSWNEHGQTDVPLLSNPTQVSLGGGHSCALDDTGVVCWGWNEHGQTDVPLLSNPTQVSLGGGHSCALDDTGVVCWGDNVYGQTDVPTLINPTQVSAGGRHSCALDDTGVVCWGYNFYGQTDVPTLINPTEVSLGHYHTCALDNTGVVCWGYNGNGETTVPMLRNPSQVSSGAFHSCVLDDTGVVCWGTNWAGQTDVPLLSNPTQFSSGGAHTCALDNTGVVCWGDNYYGQTDVPSVVSNPHVTWDFDMNGQADALTDGMLFLRYAFGLRGSMLINGAVATDSPITTAKVELSVESGLIIGDIDGDGEVNALTDGLLLLRYLFGLRDSNLINGVISENALRTEATAVETYIESYMPFADIYNTSESFNGFVLLGNNPEDPWSIWDCCGGSTPSLQMDDADHGIVAEFVIGANPTLAGLRIAEPGVYMDVSSVLENGIVQFDLKVIEPLTNSNGYWQIKMESTDRSADHTFKLSESIEGLEPVTGQWQTFTFTLQSFFDEGVDVSEIDVIMISPNWSGGDGAKYRLDNLKIYDPGETPRETPQPEGLVIYEDGQNSEWPSWASCGCSNPTDKADDAEHGTVAEFVGTSQSTVFGFRANDGIYFDATDLMASDGVLRFDFKLMSAPNDASAEFGIKVESGDAATNVKFSLTESYEGVAPILGEWQTYTYPLTQLSNAGLDISAIDIVFVYPGFSSSAGSIFRIDNVAIASQ